MSRGVVGSESIVMYNSSLIRGRALYRDESSLVTLPMDVYLLTEAEASDFTCNRTFAYDQAPHFILNITSNGKWSQWHDLRASQGEESLLGVPYIPLFVDSNGMFLALLHGAPIEVEVEVEGTDPGILTWLRVHKMPALLAFVAFVFVLTIACNYASKSIAIIMFFGLSLACVLQFVAVLAMYNHRSSLAVVLHQLTGAVAICFFVPCWKRTSRLSFLTLLLGIIGGYISFCWGVPETVEVAVRVVIIAINGAMLNPTQAVSAIDYCLLIMLLIDQCAPVFVLAQQLYNPLWISIHNQLLLRLGWLVTWYCGFLWCLPACPII